MVPPFPCHRFTTPCRAGTPGLVSSHASNEAMLRSLGPSEPSPPSATGASPSRNVGSPSSSSPPPAPPAAVALRSERARCISFLVLSDIEVALSLLRNNTQS
eukprot:76159-Prymnesium_polylepis.1